MRDVSNVFIGCLGNRSDRFSNSLLLRKMSNVVCENIKYSCFLIIGSLKKSCRYFYTFMAGLVIFHALNLELLKILLPFTFTSSASIGDLCEREVSTDRSK